MSPSYSIQTGDIAIAVALSRQIPEFLDPYPAEVYHSRLAGKLHLLLIACSGDEPISLSS